MCIEVLDLARLQAPFREYAVAPARRKNAVDDPAINTWTETIKNCDAFIIIAPEYNSSIPGVLKNALDAVYHEWNNKPVAFITHSGGPSGGESALRHLIDIAHALQLKPIDQAIKIPESYKAVDNNNTFMNKALHNQCITIVNTLICMVKEQRIGTQESATIKRQADHTIPLLYKITTKELWDQSKEHLALHADDAAFIHFSTAQQKNNVLKKYWGGKQAVVLTIDPTSVQGSMVLEANKPGGELYYHLYDGHIPLLAVIDSEVVNV